MISRFCRTLGVLLAGGVDISTSLKITSKVVDHVLMGEAVERIRKKVISGASLAESIRSQKIFPRLVSKMTAVGEKSGRTTEMLLRTADYYEGEFENTLHKLTVIIEPSLIILIGLFVCVIVVALYLPIFNVAQLIQ